MGHVDYASTKSLDRATGAAGADGVLGEAVDLAFWDGKPRMVRKSTSRSSQLSRRVALTLIRPEDVRVRETREVSPNVSQRQSTVAFFLRFGESNRLSHQSRPEPAMEPSFRAPLFVNRAAELASCDRIVVVFLSVLATDR